jgi:hypothetical protein
MRKAYEAGRAKGREEATRELQSGVESNALTLPLPRYAWRKAESNLVMNFTVEFFRTAERQGARDTGADFDSRRQSRCGNGEGEVALRHARHATKTGRVAHLGSGEARIVRLGSG